MYSFECNKSLRLTITCLMYGWNEMTIFIMSYVLCSQTLIYICFCRVGPFFSPIFSSFSLLCKCSAVSEKWFVCSYFMSCGPNSLSIYLIEFRKWRSHEIQSLNELSNRLSTRVRPLLLFNIATDAQKTNNQKDCSL